MIISIRKRTGADLCKKYQQENMKREITFEWAIEDTRTEYSGFRHGTSTFVIEGKSFKNMMNTVLFWVSDISPVSMIEGAGINMDEYKDNPNSCRYHYRTYLTRIISIKNVQ